MGRVLVTGQRFGRPGRRRQPARSRAPPRDHGQPAHSRREYGCRYPRPSRTGGQYASLGRIDPRARYLDLGPVLAERAKQRSIGFEYDAHFNAEANALIGPGAATQKPLATVSGTIHAGLALSIVLFVLQSALL